MVSTIECGPLPPRPERGGKDAVLGKRGAFPTFPPHDDGYLKRIPTRVCKKNKGMKQQSKRRAGKPDVGNGRENRRIYQDRLARIIIMRPEH